MLTSPHIDAMIINHARRLAALSPPQESVGVIRDGAYISLVNSAEDPTISFRISGDDPALIGAEAIVHSHPGGPSFPSAHDMTQQIASGLPWLIAVTPTAASPKITEEVFAFGLPPQMTEGRGYRHGVDDCYSLIRGFYKDVMGIELIDFPREWGWWHDGHNLYADGLGPAGFTMLPDDAQLQCGDVFLASVRAKVVNHAGIWLGDGLIYHHLGGAEGYQPERLARKEPVERWQKFINGWARFSRAK